ncbi:MAG: GNAT family N-acetyltransferase [Elainellaceae cyanobacterium]
MKLHRFHDIQTFRDRTQAYLLKHEAEHNLLLGILNTLQHDPDRYPEPPYLVTVTADSDADSDIVAIAIRTPPYKLVLSKVVIPSALTLIAQDVYQEVCRAQTQLPGASGLVTEAQIFVEIWQQLTGQTAKLAMQMRIHQLTAVQPVATASGKLRQATPADRPVALQWFRDFVAEAIASFGANPEHLTDRAIANQHLYLWEDSVPVSFACGSQFLPTAGRIGPVYTPPAYRRQGYATACVAALSQTLLDQGCQRCFLFTDLANPTSNHIYQAIGYRPICDWDDYMFVEALN